MKNQNTYLKLKWLGIDTQQELVVFMPRNCHVCRAEGFQSLTRVMVSNHSRSIIATLNVTDSEILNQGEVSLSESAWKKFNAHEGDLIQIHHLPPLHSMGHVRAKIYGQQLDQQSYHEIINDITEEKYSNVFLSSFVTACSGKMTSDEICFLTRAMIDSGNKIKWPQAVIADKHSIGGLPGNRVTMLLVPILASLGITIPKSSSRAITSPSGTADTMEVVTHVNLSSVEMKHVVEKENGCIVWGGAANMSPADDIIIRVERALDIDSEEQMIASIISKKAAAGATHCIIDIPYGESAKIRTLDGAVNFKNQLEIVAAYVGVNVKSVITDGSQPIGNGIGPALEARDVLRVLRNEKTLPTDLKEKSLKLSGALIEMILKKSETESYNLAKQQLEDGSAYKKFIAICEAQGGFKEPVEALFKNTVVAEKAGRFSFIQNRNLARIAKLAGAPGEKTAGVDFFVQLNQHVEMGQPLFEIHAQSQGELNYALEFYHQNKNDILRIED